MTGTAERETHYGMMSESIHGSWNGSVGWCLVRNADGSFSPFPHYHPTDVRHICPTLKFMNEPFRLWLQRIDAYDDGYREVLDWIDQVNLALFVKFDTFNDGL